MTKNNECPLSPSPRPSRKVLGIISLSTAVVGIMTTILLWLLCTLLEGLDISAPYTICAVAYVGAAVAALVMGIVAWRSPYGKAGAGIATILLLLVTLIMPVRVETTRSAPVTMQRSQASEPYTQAY